MLCPYCGKERRDKRRCPKCHKVQRLELRGVTEDEDLRELFAACRENNGSASMLNAAAEGDVQTSTVEAQKGPALASVNRLLKRINGRMHRT